MKLERVDSVFVAYAHADLDRAKAVIDAIEGRGYKVWWDHGLVGGQDFTREIVSTIRTAESVLIFLSENSLKSNFIRYIELPHARLAGRTIPVKLSPVPDDEIPLELAKQHWCDLSEGPPDETNKGFLDLISGLESHRKKARTEYNLFVGIFVAVLLIAAGFTWFLSSSHRQEMLDDRLSPRSLRFTSDTLLPELHQFVRRADDLKEGIEYYFEGPRRTSSKTFEEERDDVKNILEPFKAVSGRYNALSENVRSMEQSEGFRAIRYEVFEAVAATGQLEIKTSLDKFTSNTQRTRRRLIRSLRDDRIHLTGKLDPARLRLEELENSLYNELDLPVPQGRGKCDVF